MIAAKETKNDPIGIDRYDTLQDRPRNLPSMRDIQNMRCTALAATLVASCLPNLSANADERVEYFETHIRPALVEHCLECHTAGDDDLGGNLALDSALGLTVGGDSGPAVIAGDPDASPLIEALRYDGLEMPPNGKLPIVIVKHFEQWVQDGAVDPRTADPSTSDVPSAVAKRHIDLEEGRQFWAFQPLDPMQASRKSSTETAAATIDQLVDRQRASEGLPVPAPADPATRLRRVAYDLTGLPPSTETVDTFLADPSDERWVAIVDQLLDTPAYGEHWARMWLDVARYADSNGSDFNATHHDAWRYRDYVIDSFAGDRPYDMFIREQLAGDLLAFKTSAQRTRQIVATGFLALGAKMLSERDKKKLALDIVDEQIDTVGKAFLGMTLGCARCHDHKFDPIPTADYYALAGIFQSTETVQGEIQQYVSDLVRVPLPVSPELAGAVAAYDVKRQQLEQKKKSLQKRIDMMRSDASLAGALSRGVIVDNDEAELVGNWKLSTYSKKRFGKDYVHNDRQKELMTATFRIALPSPGEYEVRVSYSNAGGREDRVPVEVGTANGPVAVILNQTVTPKISETFQPIGRFTFSKSATVQFSTAGTTDYVIVDAVQIVPVAEADLPLPTELDDSALVEQRRDVEKQLAELKKEAPPPLPTALAVRDLDKPADCAVRIRGEPHREGKSIPRGFLQVAMTSEPPAMPADESGRLELADWIASPDNPLTARVYVNRVWKQLIGKGLVRSPHNFGQLGQRPTHPELLDWLATNLIANGWSTKDLIRKIVLSDVYSATSTVPADVRESDPENRLLTRANRRPLSAEQLRDSILLLSGQLERGRTIAPMAGIGKLVSSASGSGKSEKSSASTRVRSVYLPVIRNEVSPLLTSFDFADPEVSVGKRAQTNVPSQALFLLNSNFMHTAAGAIATRCKTVDELHQAILARPASQATRSQLQAFVDSYDSNAAGLAAACHALLASTNFRMLE